jgi:DNA polymerase III subunit epsilon
MAKRVLEFAERLTTGWQPRAFVALDFETANRDRKSACALALVRVEGRRIVSRRTCLVRPPTSYFEFTHIHGIRWADVRAKPAFGPTWKTMTALLDGVDFIAAHNAAFDCSVLKACCTCGRISLPDLPFLCTVQLARLRWQVHPTKLPNVCDFLGLALEHHDPLSDAEACARIVLAAMGGPAARPRPRTPQ